jgi:exosortase
MDCAALKIMICAVGDSAGISRRFSRGESVVAASLLAAGLGWSYWPSLTELWRAWGREADYSHGYLVAPLAAAFLWLRRDTCPTPAGGPSLGGLALFGFGIALRMAGALWYVEAIEAWSLLFWVAGACWLLGGFALLRWALPAIGFLAFMIPLPFRVEGLLSLPLQRIATGLSCWLLQCLGEPAIAEGNVVLINDSRLLVAEACGGLRIFMSILAVAYVYCVVIHRSWWTTMGLLLSVLPITLLTNALRIVATGMAREHLSREWEKLLIHDVAGWLMAPLAALLMYYVIWYLDKLVVQVETVSTRELLRTHAAR